MISICVVSGESFVLSSSLVGVPIGPVASLYTGRFSMFNMPRPIAWNNSFSLPTPKVRKSPSIFPASKPPIEYPVRIDTKLIRSTNVEI